jgi:hypothetical protein
MYTTHDVSAIGPTPSSDDRMSLYCQIRFARTRGLTGNKKGVLATVTINWQEEGYADNKEGHIDNNNCTLAKGGVAYWQREWYTDNKEGTLATTKVFSRQEGHTCNKGILTIAY